MVLCAESFAAMHVHREELWHVCSHVHRHRHQHAYTKHVFVDKTLMHLFLHTCWRIFMSLYCWLGYICKDRRMSVARSI